MKIEGVRATFTRSHRDLKRGRRLYFFLCREWCGAAKSPEKYRERVHYCVKRAKDRGLFAPSTFFGDSVHSALRHFAKVLGMRMWAWRELDERVRVASMNASAFRRWKMDQVKSKRKRRRA